MYRDVRDRDLERRAGLFMAEGRLVVRTLLGSSRFGVHSLLVTEPALRSLADAAPDAFGETPVYLASQRVMDAVTGFHIHRGCLAAGWRGEPIDAGALVAGFGAGPRCVVVLEDVSNHDNVGGVFRSGAAFGVDAVLLTGGSCDPLYRKALRVSMGGVLRVPFARVGSAPEAAAMLTRARFETLALTPDAGSEDIGVVSAGERVAIMVGAEGPGLSAQAMAACGRRVRIAMPGGVDSLNLSVAAGIALHRLSPHAVRSGA